MSFEYVQFFIYIMSIGKEILLILVLLFYIFFYFGLFFRNSFYLCIVSLLPVFIICHFISNPFLKNP